jgi:hypothetical protein
VRGTKHQLHPPASGFNREDNNMTTIDLTRFTGGTDNYYRHALCRTVTYTDGVKYLAETANAYWLIDKVATNQLEAKIRREEFQCWKLKVKDNTAILTCDDGNDNIVHREEITYTDFPLDEVALWVSHNVILLPSEY